LLVDRCAKVIKKARMTNIYHPLTKKALPLPHERKQKGHYLPIDAPLVYQL
jgi:hypothetical protein